MTNIPSVTLNNDVAMPQLGFGVFLVSSGDTVSAVSSALRAGYRSIDTAAVYGNEKGVGQALAESAVPREELFITTKVWNGDQGYDATLRAFDESLHRLGLDYLDLYLIHWPTPARDRYLDTWKALERLRSDGRVRAVGVSNFEATHLERIIDSSGNTPAVNQVELHPRLQQAALREFHARHGIVTEAWSPLARGGDLMEHPTVTALADKHGRTAAQVILRWHLQLGNVVIPKSVTPKRIAQNIDVFDFALNDDDLAELSTLDAGERIGPEPDKFNEI